MMKRLAFAITATLAAVLGGLALFIFLGVYDVGADTPHWEVTRKVIEIVRDRAIEVRAKAIQLPNLEDAQLVLKSAGQYAAMCVNCHLAPGKTDSEIRPGLYPKPPNLSERTFDPRTVFWVTKHGLKTSGMPAWGLGHDDAALWSIVALVVKLPGMSAQQYKEIVVKAPPDEEMKPVDKGDGHEHRHDSPGVEPASPKAHHPH